MDITLKRPYLERTKGKKGSRRQDPWDGTLDADRNCIFCGHHEQFHGARALMVKKPNAKRRTRAGLSFLSCTICAEAKQTSQVICYKAPEQFKEYAVRAGLLVG